MEIDVLISDNEQEVIRISGDSNNEEEDGDRSYEEDVHTGNSKDHSS